MGLFNWLKKDPEIKKAEFVSPATGKIIPIEQVEDETFASKILGDGFAVELTDGEVIAPYGLKREDGLECLIHIGLDTVELNGAGFDVKVKQGDQVKQGQLLVKVNLEQVTGAGKSLVSPIVFSSGASFTLLKNDSAVKGEEILHLE